MIFNNSFDHRLLILGVINHKVGTISQLINVLSQQLNPQGMEGAQLDTLLLPSQFVFEPLLHFTGSFVGESHCQNFCW